MKPTREHNPPRPKLPSLPILLAAFSMLLFVGCSKKSGLDIVDWSLTNSISNVEVTADAQKNHQKFVVVHSRVVGKVPWVKSADEQWNITKHMFTLTTADGQVIQALYIWNAENMSGLGALMSFMQGNRDVELPEAAFMVSEDAIAKGSLKFKLLALPAVPLTDKLHKR